MRPNPASDDEEDDENNAKEDKKKKENEMREGDDLLTWEQIMSDPELRKLEYDNSINRKNAMLLPQRISSAITTLGWLFVGGGIILNQLGFAYVRDASGGIRIGSLNERDFQLEVVMEGRAAKKEKEIEEGGGRRIDGSNPSVSRSSGDANERRWLEGGGGAADYASPTRP